MTDKAWKAFERRIAKHIGGRRLGPTGDDGPDVVSDSLVVQCKLRKTVPLWLVSALQNATDNAGPDRLGLAVVKQKYKPDRDALVILTLGDFLDWYDPKGGDRDN